MAYSLSSVAKGATIYSAGQVLTKAAGFMLLPLYARFLSSRDFGMIRKTLAIWLTGIVRVC